MSSHSEAALRRKRWVVIITTLILAALGFVLTDVLLPPEELRVRSADGEIISLFSHERLLWFRWLLASLIGLLVLYGTDWAYEQFVTKEDFFQHISKRISIIEARLEKMNEHVAFYSDDLRVERNAIGLVRSKSAGVMWIVAKFISRQFSSSFAKLEISLNGNEYSQFAMALYPECTSSICLTSPFTPVEWFRQVFPHNADVVLSDMKKGRSVQAPPHAQALTQSIAPTKKRIVVLDSGNWISLIAQSDILREFLKMNKGVETRFVRRDDLIRHHPFAASERFDFSRYDYAVFDSEILLEWERPLLPTERRALALIDIKDVNTPDTYRGIASDVFAFQSGLHLTGDEVMARIDTELQALRKEVLTKQNLPHKYAYFVLGASAWNRIPTDPGYDLGRRELNTLQVALSTFLENDRGSWNIVHVGPGNGREIPVVVGTLGRRAISSYGLVDISPELLRIAQGHAAESVQGIDLRGFVLDVTVDTLRPVLAQLRARSPGPALIIIAGNGAILSDEQVLPLVRGAMGPNDKCVLTLELFDQSRQNAILDQYRLPSISALFVQPLSLLGLESNTEGYLEVEYNQTEARVEAYFNCARWSDDHKRVTKRVTGELPNRFRVFASLRPTEDELRRRLSDAGFTVERLDVVSYAHCCGVLCSA